MLINDIKRPKSQKRAQPRVGRGRKRGFTSGKGMKGQKSRAGHKIRPAIRDLIQRLPRLKGRGVHRNLPKSNAAKVLSFADLEAMKENTVNPETLKAAGLIKALNQRVKILANGELKKKITVEKIAVSKGAQAVIEKAGGSVVLEEKAQKPKKEVELKEEKKDKAQVKVKKPAAKKKST
ncbi:MAG: 50S ribosomal protein L15 [Candidatus Harrisonbacteria bacterium]|nr:50S ribosomal protein L15 [Candidatus Harrisonbacteria bacterium]